jgi:hypothetical protein
MLENHLNDLPIDKWGMGKKVNLNEPRETPHLCLMKNPSTSSKKGSLNPKDVGFCENVNLITKFIYISCKFKIV